MDDDLTIQRVPRLVIERKLLAALEQPENVAILANRQDLDDLIDALCGIPAPDVQAYQRRRSMATDFRELRKQAFPPVAQREP